MSQHTCRDVLPPALSLGSHLNRPVSSIPPDDELSDADRTDLVDRVSHALAETYSLYLRTVGPIYCNLDKLTRQEYDALIPAIGETAECIRSIGRPIPKRFAPASESSEKDANPTQATQYDDAEGDEGESPLAFTTFTRRLREALGIPVEPEIAQSDHLRS